MGVNTFMLGVGSPLRRVLALAVVATLLVPRSAVAQHSSDDGTRDSSYLTLYIFSSKPVALNNSKTKAVASA